MFGFIPGALFLPDTFHLCFVQLDIANLSIDCWNILQTTPHSEPKKLNELTSVFQLSNFFPANPDKSHGGILSKFLPLGRLKMKQLEPKDSEAFSLSV